MESRLDAQFVDHLIPNGAIFVDLLFCLSGNSDSVKKKDSARRKRHFQPLRKSQSLHTVLFQKEKRVGTYRSIPLPSPMTSLYLHVHNASSLKSSYSWHHPRVRIDNHTLFLFPPPPARVCENPHATVRIQGRRLKKKKESITNQLNFEPDCPGAGEASRLTNQDGFRKMARSLG